MISVALLLVLRAAEVKTAAPQKKFQDLAGEVIAKLVLSALPIFTTGRMATKLVLGNPTEEDKS